ncbi:MAG: rhodanese-like domain-containing protein [Planctomycetota bacterium]|nr:rhodanese-like domain-containing protein [Planctomycetota bacterium]
MIPPRSLPLQMLAVAATALALAFAANSLHPQGLESSRDYFAKPQHSFQTVTMEEFTDFVTYLEDEAGDIVYLDARRSGQYQTGHVPGSWNVPRNDPAALEAALGALQVAAYVVIYCQGGHCEDSIFLAEDLVYRHGIDFSIVHIFEPGWEAWQKQGGAERAGADR